MSLCNLVFLSELAAALEFFSCLEIDLPYSLGVIFLLTICFLLKTWESKRRMVHKAGCASRKGLLTS